MLLLLLFLSPFFDDPMNDQLQEAKLHIKGPPGRDRRECSEFFRLRAPSTEIDRYISARWRELGHLSWYIAHVETYREEELKHVGESVYLDYGGCSLYSRAQLQSAQEALLRTCFANPHTSPATAQVVEEARQLVLSMFGVCGKTHTVIFTSGATQGLELLGENFAWGGACGAFLYADECHTSVLGLRQFARRANTQSGIFAMKDLHHLADKGLAAAKPIYELKGSSNSSGSTSIWSQEAGTTMTKTTNNNK